MLIGAAPIEAEAGDERLTVIELFTSQGCSSCPPADQLLGELAGRKDVLALSIHVDYWDYIGWKDPFADPAHTARQRGYARLFSLRYVYTPQMVIDGAYQAVGSKRSEVRDYIEKSRKLPRVPVSLTGGPGDVRLELPASGVSGDVYVFSVFFDREHKTRIARGENAGSEMRNVNVVRAFSKIAVWNGEALSMKVPASASGGDACAVLLQSAETGQIIGAAQVALDGT